jgi:pyridoxamine 5'-phosphate oxidase
MTLLSEMRENYMRGGLSETDAGNDPFPLFHRWFEDARAGQLSEPNAMTLATVGEDHKPSARAVLLKGLDERGFTFFTNYDSRKGRELDANPFAALVFLWQQLERQVRIEGMVEKVTAKESDDYFVNRPLGSRLGAWASRQSDVISGREYLEAQHAALMAKYPDGNVPRPDFWGGYRLIPDMIEFWQGRPSRLHDRIRFRKSPDGWIKERLSP